ncbi:MAG TPA: ATP-binding cassette domain-containing protein [Candidatus Baltobacteraceae bacterium]|nr:ATP-binding cassette domain-containing protein [Candidatus Baltobacteraceae bacterium]
MLDVRLRKARTQFTVDVRFRVASGEACAIFGASGAGKSTILACIAGAEIPDDGEIRLDDDALFPPPLPLHRRPLGYLTQDAHLFPHLRVSENVRFGLTNGARGADSWVTQLRERLQLEPIWNENVHAISGGQARRVALARMLARKPRLVLLDEPFAGLDRYLVRELVAALADWQCQLRFTMLVVDHEADLLEQLCARAIAIERGRVVQDAPWHALKSAPATPLLARILAP